MCMYYSLYVEVEAWLVIVDKVGPALLEGLQLPARTHATHQGDTLLLHRALVFLLLTPRKQSMPPNPKTTRTYYE